MATGILTLLGVGITTANAAPVELQNTVSLVNVTKDTQVVLERPANVLKDNNEILVAGHYSHSSHVSHASHVSHYSSRY